MFGKKRAIRKYLVELYPALVQRYGKRHPYALKHVEATVTELGLSRRHIRYAYLLCCDRNEVIRKFDLAPETVGHMDKTLDNTASGGMALSLVRGAFGNGDGDDGSDADPQD